VQFVIGLVAVVLLISFIVTFWPIALAIAMALIAPRIVRRIRKHRYFASDEFAARKSAIASVVAEHNDVTEYARSIRDGGHFYLGSSSSGAQAHLASFENVSRHNYRRDRNVAAYGSANVHNCSLQVVRSAAAEPVKYLAKYFDIKATEERLIDVEALGESVSRFEAAVNNLKQRESSIKSSFNPPAFILKHYEGEFKSQVGLDLAPVEVPYPQYSFEYVSAGGNSSQRTVITLDTRTIDALINMLAERIRFRQSAAGQRALMTANFRNLIKARDNYACRYCQVSLAQEPHLLLEVDHVIPVSKGGLSTAENLQTLCWRCNRSKSNKILHG